MLIFVIGAPGSGKGTLCQRWCLEHGHEHLSIGDHLRSLARDDSAAGQLDQHIKDSIARSDLLNTPDILSILQNKIDRGKSDDVDNIMIDGFPRTVEQAKAAEAVIGPPDVVVLLECSEELAKERYLSRSLPGRDSDSSIFDRRYQQFKHLNTAIVEEYARRGLILKVDSSSPTDVSYISLVSAMTSFRRAD